MRNKIICISLILCLALSVPTAFAADAVTISHIQGLDPARGLMTEVPIRYYVHFHVGDQQLYGIFNAFKMYSPDSAHWQPLYLMQTVMLSSYLTEHSGFFYNSNDGSGVDTVAVHGFTINGPGIPPGFDSNICYMETKLTNAQIGKTLCLDSAWESNGITGFWLWDVNPDPDVPPTWDGAHCYEIVDCCSGNRGDLNGDGVGPNTVDLS